MALGVPQVNPAQHVTLGARAYGFTVGGQGYMVSPGVYSELIKNPSWSALPNVQHHFAGLLNVRGTIVPVFHLDCFINGTTPATAAPYVLVIGTLAQAAALVLNEKPQAIDLSRSVQTDDYLHAPKAIAHCIKHSYRCDNQVWLELSHEVLFSTLAG
ncbi:MAG TPA: chemotaxis protein CheW [Cellvibrionaceae bacterium]|nr:chemotaxis protein CheW [Cellvibrionaceae bacterium]HMW72274.1 chemotaxis protein CheW [Cellvibrionaceae bacterium]HMY37838.1 chemotaxis protein CheW [Marinagarivorans sp.]HNG58340.1 chemotaxis protein CheW [Cellvibrionaceae bacterium]